MLKLSRRAMLAGSAAAVAVTACARKPEEDLAGAIRAVPSTALPLALPVARIAAWSGAWSSVNAQSSTKEADRKPLPTSSRKVSNWSMIADSSSSSV